MTILPRATRSALAAASVAVVTVSAEDATVATFAASTSSHPDEGGSEMLAEAFEDGMQGSDPDDSLSFLPPRKKAGGAGARLKGRKRGTTGTGAGVVERAMTKRGMKGDKGTKGEKGMRGGSTYRGYHDDRYYGGGGDRRKRGGQRGHYEYSGSDDDYYIDDHYYTDEDDSSDYGGKTNKTNKKGGGKQPRGRGRRKSARSKGGGSKDHHYSKSGYSKKSKSKPHPPPHPTLPPWHPPIPAPTPAPIEVPCSDHRDILLHFYELMNGPNWAKQDGWGFDFISHCHWFGVICGDPKRPFCVTGLHLQNNILDGNLEFTRLDEIHTLASLDLSLNRDVADDVNFDTGVKGRFPGTWDFGHLHHLVYLDLSENSLTGNIPSTIAELTSLQQMYLENNRLGFEIPTEIGTMSSLGILRLDDNLFRGSIPSELGNLYNLGVLKLQGNNELTGDLVGDHPICQLRITYAGRRRTSGYHGNYQVQYDYGYATPGGHHGGGNRDRDRVRRGDHHQHVPQYHPNPGHGQSPYHDPHHPPYPNYPPGMAPGLPRPPVRRGVLSELWTDCQSPGNPVVCDDDCCTQCFAAP